MNISDDLKHFNDSGCCNYTGKWYKKEMLDKAGAAERNRIIKVIEKIELEYKRYIAQTACPDKKKMCKIKLETVEFIKKRIEN